ncbi:MAG: helix-turn-helix domain-containing protein [Cyanobacteria bacterium RI_101]|nr:helix-turn-helix domain-containing protein [Cyanobacteria bacterium RI_101]
MGKAGQALRETLIQHKISQNQLAVMMGIDRMKIYRWYHEKVDPTGDTIVEIVKAINQINSQAADTFIQRYLGDLVE